MTTVTEQPPPVFLSRTSSVLLATLQRIEQRQTHTTRKFTTVVVSADRPSRTDHLSSVFNVKRLIGRKFSDPEVQSDIKQFPFKVVDESGRPYIKVQYRAEDKEFVGLVISQLIIF